MARIQRHAAREGRDGRRAPRRRASTCIASAAGRAAINGVATRPRIPASSKAAVDGKHDAAVTRQRGQRRRYQQDGERERHHQADPDRPVDQHADQAVAPVAAEPRQIPDAHAIARHAGQHLREEGSDRRHAEHRHPRVMRRLRSASASSTSHQRSPSSGICSSATDDRERDPADVERRQACGPPPRNRRGATRTRSRVR